MTLEPLLESEYWRYGPDIQSTLSMLRERSLNIRRYYYKHSMECPVAEIDKIVADYAAQLKEIINALGEILEGVTQEEYCEELKKRLQQDITQDNVNHLCARGISYIKDAKRELPLLKPALTALIGYIQREEPDEVVFLDKGARLFGTPMHKYLRQLKLRRMPKIRFYNDNDLKNKPGEKSQKQAETEFARFKDKKVFFIDEIIAHGRSAWTIARAKAHIGNENIFYFALHNVVGLDIYIPDDPKFVALSGALDPGLTQIICPVTYDASQIYVRDKEENHDGVKVTTTASSFSEKTREANRERYRVTKQLQDMIYQTLMELPR